MKWNENGRRKKLGKEKEGPDQWLERGKSVGVHVKLEQEKCVARDFLSSHVIKESFIVFLWSLTRGFGAD